MSAENAVDHSAIPEDQNPILIAPASRQRAARAVQYSTCKGCDAKWTASSLCHCAGCHCSFSGLSLFDAHRRDIKGQGTCLHPATLRKVGNPMMQLFGTVWRGPEMTEAQKAERGWA